MLERAADITEAMLPNHIAIIMDGNGRWAQERALPRAEGHRQGAEAVRRTVTACRELGVPYLTLFAFSSENWKRPETEVDDLMDLLRIYLTEEVDELNDQDVRLRVIGDRSRLAPDICSLISQGEGLTASNSAMTLTIALNYGGQAELVCAIKQISERVAQGELSSNEVDESLVSQHLYTKDLPDPDLLIRTSGEKRLSNFLLWQSAYSELLFVDQYWPDFDKDSVIQAVQEFSARDRRFGATAD